MKWWLLKRRGGKVEILPRDVDLSKYVDSVEVDVDNFGGDYHKLRKELREKK